MAERVNPASFNIASRYMQLTDDELSGGIEELHRILRQRDLLPSWLASAREHAARLVAIERYEAFQRHEALSESAPSPEKANTELARWQALLPDDELAQISDLAEARYNELLALSFVGSLGESKYRLRRQDPFAVIAGEYLAIDRVRHVRRELADTERGDSGREPISNDRLTLHELRPTYAPHIGDRQINSYAAYVEAIRTYIEQARLPQDSLRAVAQRLAPHASPELSRMRGVSRKLTEAKGERADALRKRDNIAKAGRRIASKPGTAFARGKEQLANQWQSHNDRAKRMEAELQQLYGDPDSPANQLTDELACHLAIGDALRSLERSLPEEVQGSPAMQPPELDGAGSGL